MCPVREQPTSQKTSTLQVTELAVWAVHVGMGVEALGLFLVKSVAVTSQTHCIGQARRICIRHVAHRVRPPVVSRALGEAGIIDTHKHPLLERLQVCSTARTCKKEAEADLWHLPPRPFDLHRASQILQGDAGLSKTHSFRGSHCSCCPRCGLSWHSGAAQPSLLGGVTDLELLLPSTFAPGWRLSLLCADLRSLCAPMSDTSPQDRRHLPAPRTPRHWFVESIC